ncbi:metal-dependent hydrolase [Siphonobacter sp. SORGH_AS_1065]|uniref:metal-dependent hydrolase n=1 Tax=Siphonobacter sp. SORGH_AS_1065 TaxID=3041795 RepID=UPI0027898F63|nr:metal-dependent hydrolase [Siphonobacter sp. SORGH_AS_1065]MDQ1088835.1 inner membrane protein [Siphonobacter sp. SORGH_AS_1065]
MDTLTHITIGACVGEAFLAKRIGKKALLIGAVAQNLPDIDALDALFLSPAQNLLVHRGITHSLVLAFLAPLGFSWVLRKKFPQVNFLHFYLFFLIQLLLHDFLDVCNSYGTGIFEPFSHQRITFNLLYVIDPLFTLPLVLSCLALLYLKNQHSARKTWVSLGLISCFLYLSVTLFHKRKINHSIEESLRTQSITSTDYFTTPTPFNSLLWYAVAAVPGGYQIGYRSVFDHGWTPFHFVPQREELLRNIQKEKEVQDLKYFARGFYTISDQDHALQFNVLRFGQVLGWENPDAAFAFHFYLNADYDNRLVMQRGRFSGWNRGSIQRMIQRIGGQQVEAPKTLE